jgi:hypothetical protein
LLILTARLSDLRQQLENATKYSKIVHLSLGPGVAEWLRHCAASREVSVSNPSGVAGDFFSEAYDGTMCSGVDSASKNEYQDTPGSKAGRCVRLTTYHLLVPNVKKTRGLNLPDPHGPVQACSRTAFYTYL